MLPILEYLKFLALPATSQLERQPTGSCKPDEIALEFDDAMKYWMPRIGNTLSAEQRNALIGIEHHLTKMSNSQDAYIWSEAGIYESEEWRQLRALAEEGIRIFSRF